MAAANQETTDTADLLALMFIRLSILFVYLHWPECGNPRVLANAATVDYEFSISLRAFDGDLLLAGDSPELQRESTRIRRLAAVGQRYAHSRFCAKLPFNTDFVPFVVDSLDLDGLVTHANRVGLE